LYKTAEDIITQTLLYDSQISSSLTPKISANFKWDHLNGESKYKWGGLKWTIFDKCLISRYISETVQDGDIATNMEGY